MSDFSPTIKEYKDSQGVAGLLDQLAEQVKQAEEASGPFHFIGIHTRGIPLAKRLMERLGRDLKGLGTLDINLYRDDLSQAHAMPVVKETKIPFSLEGAKILLVDDVLYTGRTIRSALDALMDLGRPSQIALLVLVDRGGRELPIQADFCGQKVDVKAGDNVKVRLEEIDGKDGLELVSGS